MLEILTRGGLETGFSVQSFEEGCDNEFYEHNLWGENYMRDPPYVLKHARLASNLHERAELFKWKIDHVFIFVRNYKDCIASTLKLERGGSFDKIKRRYFSRIGKITYQCVEHEWPFTFIQYPRFQTDWDYFRRSVGEALGPIPGDLRGAWETSVRRRNGAG